MHATLLTDSELLARYADKQSAWAFRELVDRHAGLVYSAARRQVRDGTLAEDVTQAVFIVLARRASTVRGAHLTGWLMKTARFASRDALRAGFRRHRHEGIAAGMRAELVPPAHGDDNDGDWRTLVPLLDEAMSRLSDADRTAVTLRFFEDRPYKEVATTLGIAEEAARKRVERAVGRLRTFFASHGQTLTPGLLLGAVGGTAAQPPATLGGDVMLTVWSTTSTPLVDETIRLLSWPRVKYAAGMTAVVAGLLAWTAVLAGAVQWAAHTPWGGQATVHEAHRAR